MIDIVIDIRRENINGIDIVMRSGFDPDTLALTFIFIVFNGFSNKSFNKMKNYLIGFIWHEVYHLRDHIDDKILEKYDLNIADPIKRIREASKYMLSETEMMAHIVSIMAEIKKSGQKFNDVLMEYIDSNFYNSSRILKEKLKSDPFIKKEVEELERRTYNTIMEQANKRYPLLKKRYEKS